LIPILTTFCLALFAFLLYVTQIGRTSAWARARGREREPAAWAKRISANLNSNPEERERFEEEFKAIVGRPSRQYMNRGLVITGLLTLLIWFLTNSPVLTPTIGLGFFYWWRNRAYGKLEKARNSALDNELLPYARHISRSLERSISLRDALADLIRSDPETPLKRSIRRALSSTRTLEAGLRAEAAFAGQMAIREFFEILAEGATSVQRSSVTHQALDRYIELNTRRRTVFQKALQTTAQARSTRTLLLGIIPIMYTISTLRTGSDLMWHSVGGNVVTLMVVMTLVSAFVFSNFMIKNILKDF
jgi:hypothetical protein